MTIYSPIYPPGIKPARPGLYLTSDRPYWSFVCLHRWDGLHWFDASGHADATSMIGGETSGQNRYWRGLAFDPTQGVR